MTNKFKIEAGVVQWESKHGTVSFGFLWAPPVEELKAQLRASGKGRLREPSLQD